MEEIKRKKRSLHLPPSSVSQTNFALEVSFVLEGSPLSRSRMEAGANGLGQAVVMMV